MIDSVIITSEDKILNNLPCMSVHTKTKSVNILRPESIVVEGQLSIDDDGHITMTNWCLNSPNGVSCCIEIDVWCEE